MPLAAAPGGSGPAGGGGRRSSAPAGPGHVLPAPPSWPPSWPRSCGEGRAHARRLAGRRHPPRWRRWCGATVDATAATSSTWESRSCSSGWPRRRPFSRHATCACRPARARGWAATRSPTCARSTTLSGEKLSLGAVLDVRRDGRTVERLRPTRGYYPAEDAGGRAIERFFDGQATSEVAPAGGSDPRRVDRRGARRAGPGPVIREADRRFPRADPELQGLLIAAIAERYEDPTARRPPSA